VRAGQMDTQVTVQSPTEGFSSAGGVVETWATVRTPWVQRRQTGGNESLRSDRETPEQAVEFWGHYVDWSDITTRHRILLGGVQHNIVRVDLVRAKGSALIVCTVRS